MVAVIALEKFGVIAMFCANVIDQILFSFIPFQAFLALKRRLARMLSKMSIIIAFLIEGHNAMIAFVLFGRSGRVGRSERPGRLGRRRRSGRSGKGERESLQSTRAFLLVIAMNEIKIGTDEAT